MDMANMKALIAKHGGMEFISAMYFDNGRTYRRRDGVKFEDNCVLDEAHGSWTIRSKQSPQFNNNEIYTVMEESVDALTSILFVEKLSDHPLIDRTI